MSSSRLTLIGLYNYDNTIFDNLTLPSGITKDTLVNNILMRGAEFEVLYPDADFIKFSIGAWATKWQPTFQRWIDALAIEYEPLENYNRIEDWTDTDDGTGSRTGSGTGETSGTTGSTTTHRVSADDAGDQFTAKDQDELHGTDSSSTSTTSQEDTSNHNAGEHHGVIHGNIGVTTSQQMLISELDLGYWNIYEKITDLFLTEFVIPVY